MKEFNAVKIRELCAEKRISLKELSEKIDITQNGLQSILNNNTTSIDTLLKVCNYFNVPVGYFFNEIPSIGYYNQGIQQIANGDGNNQVINLSHEIDVLKKENEGLKNELRAKNELIEVLKKLK